MECSLLKWFAWEHLKSPLREVSMNCKNLATVMDNSLPECEEKTAGMRKLLEAKDCFVRAKLEEKNEA